MSTKYKFNDPDACYFVTFAVVGWVDLFTGDAYKNILLESWRYCQQQKGLLIRAYVIMTNHVHMIISKNSDTLLEAVMLSQKMDYVHENPVRAGFVEKAGKKIVTLNKESLRENGITSR